MPLCAGFAPHHISGAVGLKLRRPTTRPPVVSSAVGLSCSGGVWRQGGPQQSWFPSRGCP